MVMKNRNYITKTVMLSILIFTLLISSSCKSDEGKDNNTNLTYTGNFVDIGDLNTPRFYHTATRLSDGKVLITGGENSSSVLASAELYNPDTGTLSAAGSLNTQRTGHSATLLPDGKVLIVGGSVHSTMDDISSMVSSSEIYDPDTGSFIVSGNLNDARSNHTATLLSDGKVLITGCMVSNVSGLGLGNLGISPDVTFFGCSSSELYDPDTGTFTPTGSMNIARGYHTATLLPNGKVLIAGGKYDNDAQASAELYDPDTGTFTPAGNMNIERINHTATLLSNGRVLITGCMVRNVSGLELENLGISPEVTFTSCSSSELYDPDIGTFTPTGSMNIGRGYHTATLLPNGKVLITGGIYITDALASAELYDPDTGTFTPTGNMNTERTYHTATLLSNGKVLIAGPNSIVELYQ